MQHRRRAGFNGYRITDEYVIRIREQSAHRGPDGGETWVADDGRVGLDFRRLAIIDPSDKAMQPFANEDGAVRLVFNGEIHNNREIRAELEALLGHSLRADHSDTETIDASSLYAGTTIVTVGSTSALPGSLPPPGQVDEQRWDAPVRPEQRRQDVQNSTATAVT